jgi:hypothetical protein
VSTPVIVYVLTALAALVILLTRIRLKGGDRGAGHAQVGTGALNVHTFAGTLALLFWVPFLVAGNKTLLGSALFGIIAIFFWWVTTIAGLLILLRWLPSRGRHASEASEDTWSDGPGLSLLAHFGMLCGVAVFTFAYLTSAV